MLVHQLKAVFIHIPKTAGQSIEHCFLRHPKTVEDSRDKFLLRQNSDPSKGPPSLAHLTAGEYLSHGYVTPEAFTHYFKFSFVRNPWARLVSEYNWRGYHSRWRFKDWLYRAFPQPEWSDTWRHVMPQYDYLFDSAGNSLVDFIGHFERLEDDFNWVRDHIEEGLPNLPHINQSLKKGSGAKGFLLWYVKQLLKLKQKAQGQCQRQAQSELAYLDYYDSKTWTWVAKRYQKDIETFGYSSDISLFENKRVSCQPIFFIFGASKPTVDANASHSAAKL